jgi:hypothetical protein
MTGSFSNNLVRITRVLHVHKRTLRQLAPEAIVGSKRSLALETRLPETFQAMWKRPLRSIRIRCQGDLNLQHLRFTGSDFVMLDTFRSAANTAFHKQTSSGEAAPDRWPAVENGRAAWTACVSTH